MRNGSDRLPGGLYALCDDGIRPDLPLVEKARQLLQGGVRVIQMRLKKTPDAQALSVLRQVVPMCRAHQAVCVVNDRVDWALLSEATGVHLGDDDLPTAEARRLLGPRALIGATVRNLEQIRAAHAQGADYVGLGPVFATQTKSVDAPPLGLGPLTQWTAASPLPIVAIAGINTDNIEQVAATGVWGAAVGSALFAGDIGESARTLQLGFARGTNRAKRGIVG